MRSQKSCHDPHGTNNRYVAGCSCIDCCDAHAEYMKRARNGRVYVGISVDPKRARRHVMRLLECFTVSEISRRSGVDRSTIRNIRDGNVSRIHQRTLEALAGVSPQPFVTRTFRCRQCGHTVVSDSPHDKRTVYCSEQCEKQYWRMVTKRRPTALANKVKTACPKGHAYTPENTYSRPGTTWRECRQCKRDWAERARGGSAVTVRRHIPGGVS